MNMPPPDPIVLSRKAELVARLFSVLPADAVIHDEIETRAYECDALTAYKCPPLLAVLPRSTAQVSDVLRICHEMNVPVVPRGSGTSLAGGGFTDSGLCDFGRRADERRSGDRLSKPHDPCAGRAHEPKRFWRNRRRRVLLCA